MGEFLKEYHLYDQMSRLNNDCYFASDFQVNQLHDFLCSLREDGELKTNDMTLRIYLVNFRKSKQKTVYIILKWLFCLHRVIQHLSNVKLIEKIYDNLSRTQPPKVEDKVDQFINQGIVRPYIHFLAKICLVAISEKEEGRNQFNKQNIHDKNSKNNLAFMKLNLARSVLAELVPTLVEMHNYFLTYYPLLSKIHSLLHRDVHILLKDIRAEMKIQSYLGIKVTEIEAIQSQVDRLQCGGQGEDLPLQEDMSIKMGMFMESGGKEMREIMKDAFD